jgi:hypothetical protein
VGEGGSTAEATESAEKNKIKVGKSSALSAVSAVRLSVLMDSWWIGAVKGG